MSTTTAPASMRDAQALLGRNVLALGLMTFSYGAFQGICQTIVPLAMDGQGFTKPTIGLGASRLPVPCRRDRAQRRGAPFLHRGVRPTVPPDHAATHHHSEHELCLLELFLLYVMGGSFFVLYIRGNQLAEHPALAAVAARIGALQSLAKDQLGAEIPWMSYIGDADETSRAYGYIDGEGTVPESDEYRWCTKDELAELLDDGTISAIWSMQYEG